MRVNQLVNPDKDALLHHPTCGFVRWKGEYEGCDDRSLVWAKGREKDRPLVVDSTVLFCDKWEITTEDTLQNDGRS